MLAREASGVGAGPDAIERLEPGEEIVVLRAGKVARQRLVEMVVGVDEARQAICPVRSMTVSAVAGQLGGGADLLDDAVLGVETGVLQFTALAVHGDKDFGISSQQRGHVWSTVLFTLESR